MQARPRLGKSCRTQHLTTTPCHHAATAHPPCGHHNPLRLLQPPLASSATLLQVPLAPGPRGCSGCRASAAGPRPPTHSLGAGLLRAPGGGSADSWTTILPTLRPLSSRSSAAATASKPLATPPRPWPVSMQPRHMSSRSSAATTASRPLAALPLSLGFPGRPLVPHQHAAAPQEQPQQARPCTSLYSLFLACAPHHALLHTMRFSLPAWACRPKRP